MATTAESNITSTLTVVDTHTAKDKDVVLLSIYDILSEIKALFPDSTNQYDDISAMGELKKHSSDLLNYIYNEKNGDPAYVARPKSPGDLKYNWLRMLQEVEEDVTAMRGYLCGLRSDYHVCLPMFIPQSSC